MTNLPLRWGGGGMGEFEKWGWDLGNGGTILKWGADTPLRTIS